MGLILAGLVLTSAVVSRSASPSVAATTVGSAFVLGSISEIRDIEADGNATSLNFGENHILGPTFEIPPKSFVRKTILLESSIANAQFAWPKNVELCLSKTAAELKEQDCRVMKFWNVRD